MHCPKCGAEYREGFTTCATCGTELVEELSPEEEPEYINFVTVLRTGNPAIIAFAKSILTSEDIVHFVKGEGLQDLFAGGRVGTGCNPVTGCVEIQVDKNDVETAEQLLADIEETDPETYYDEEDVQESPEITNESSQIKGFLTGLIAGVLITGSLFFYYDWKEKHLTGTIEYDLNGDSHSDVFYSYENGILVKTQQDRNSDGNIDERILYVNGVVDKSRSDNNFDGRMETIGTFKDGLLIQQDVDVNDDDEPDMIEYYEHGVLSEQEWFHHKRKIVRKTTFFKLGVIRKVLYDSDLDGRFDVKTTYNAFEEHVSTGKPD